MAAAAKRRRPVGQPKIGTIANIPLGDIRVEAPCAVEHFSSRYVFIRNLGTGGLATFQLENKIGQTQLKYSSVCFWTAQLWTSEDAGSRRRAVTAP